MQSCRLNFGTPFYSKQHRASSSGQLAAAGATTRSAHCVGGGGGARKTLATQNATGASHGHRRPDSLATRLDRADRKADCTVRLLRNPS